MTPLDRTAMIALRTGATLAYALPSVRLRIRVDGGVVLDVQRPPFPEPPLPGAPPVVPPCGFRRSVAAAHVRQQAGERLSFLGLPAGDAPAVDVGLAPGDRMMAGDVLRVTLGADWLHVFATTLPVDRCKEAAGDGVRTSPGPCPHDGPTVDPSLVRVGFHRDDATDITLVHVASPARSVVSARHALDTLEGVYGRCAVAELEEVLITAS